MEEGHYAYKIQHIFFPLFISTLDNIQTLILSMKTLDGPIGQVSNDNSQSGKVTCSLFCSL